MALACSMASSKDVNGCSTTTGANTSSCQIEQVAGTPSRTVGAYREPVTSLPHSSIAPSFHGRVDLRPGGEPRPPG